MGDAMSDDDGQEAFGGQERPYVTGALFRTADGTCYSQPDILFVSDRLVVQARSA